jgi:hypothetical protein
MHAGSVLPLLTDIAVARLEASTRATLRQLAATKVPRPAHHGLAAAVELLTHPVREARSAMVGLPALRDAQLASCVDACSDIVDRLRANDNLASWRLQRESFVENVRDVEFWTVWATNALRNAAS